VLVIPRACGPCCCCLSAARGGSPRFPLARRLACCSRSGCCARACVCAAAASPSLACIPLRQGLGHVAVVVLHQHARLPAARLLPERAVARLLGIHRRAAALPPGVARQALAAQQPRRLDAQRGLVPLRAGAGSGAPASDGVGGKAPCRVCVCASAQQRRAGRARRRPRARTSGNSVLRISRHEPTPSVSSPCSGAARREQAGLPTRPRRTQARAARLVQLVALRVAPLLLGHEHHLARPRP
jgi:hypothetical protein